VAEGAPAFYRPRTIFMACGRGGYLGLVRLEDGRLNLAMALEPATLRRFGRPGAFGAALLHEAGWPPLPDLERLAWRGTPALSRRTAPLAAAGVFLLGDAAGYVEPFTGEGMTWALVSAVGLAPVAARAARAWQPELVALWARRHRELLARRQQVCRATVAALRTPPLVRGVLLLLRRWPALARPFVHHLGTVIANGKGKVG
jgi:flavin-dependent dehydrogenase